MAALIVRSTLITDHKPQCGRSSALQFDRGMTRAGCGPFHRSGQTSPLQFAGLCGLRVPAGSEDLPSHEARAWAL